MSLIQIKDYIHTYVCICMFYHKGLPWWLGKELACDEGDLGSILGLGRSPGEGKGYPLQYSVLENSMDYKSMVSQRLSDFHFHLMVISVINQKAHLTSKAKYVSFLRQMLW